MEILIYILVLVIIMIAVHFRLLRYSKVNNALINLRKELIVSENISFFLKEINIIPLRKLQKLSDQEKKEIIEYLAYMVKRASSLVTLLAEMKYYKLKPTIRQFVVDQLMLAWTSQTAAAICADIVTGNVLGYPHKNTCCEEQEFIMNNYENNIDFQKKLINILMTNKESPLLKSLEVKIMGEEIEKLQKQFTNKN